MDPNNTYTKALDEWVRNNTCKKPYADLFARTFICGDSDCKVHVTNIRTETATIEVYILKVIFHDPATIVFWSDGSKTIVKCGEGDIFDPEKGLAMAIAKKNFSNNGNYYNEFKKWLPND